ncbi:MULTISPECIES: preprotein translocase subunit YajC [Clostridium]|nr:MULTISPECIES: preprotein translocase subunit YajC [Clostridium]
MPQNASGILTIILMLGLFYAIVFIPERKRRKKYSAMLEALKLNDEILTRGGIMGKIVNVKDDYIILESGPDRARLKISKQGIASVLTEHEDVVAEE